VFSLGLRVASASEWTEAGIRLVTTRWGWAGSLVGWRPVRAAQVVTTRTRRLPADG
jgi:hypothetical protein